MFRHVSERVVLPPSQKFAEGRGGRRFLEQGILGNPHIYIYILCTYYMYLHICLWIDLYLNVRKTVSARSRTSLRTGTKISSRAPSAPLAAMFGTFSGSVVFESVFGWMGWC